MSAAQDAQIAAAVQAAQAAAQAAIQAAGQARAAAISINGISANALFWQGSWDANRYYAKYSVVLLNNVLYTSLQDSNKNHSPDTSPLWWQPFSTSGGGGTVHTNSTLSGDGSSGSPLAVVPVPGLFPLDFKLAPVSGDDVPGVTPGGPLPDADVDFVPDGAWGVSLIVIDRTILTADRTLKLRNPNFAITGALMVIRIDSKFVGDHSHHFNLVDAGGAAINYYVNGVSFPMQLPLGSLPEAWELEFNSTPGNQQWDVKRYIYCDPFVQGWHD